MQYYFIFYLSLLFVSFICIFLSVFVNAWIALFYIVPLSLFIFNRFKCFRIRCRAFSCGPAPSNEDDLKKACSEGGTPVGHGWSFFLKKVTPKNPVFTHNFCSVEPDDGYWKAGTSLRTVTRYYEKKGMAFPSLPSYQNITLGGWIMTNSHGSSGDVGEPSSSRFYEIQYLPKNSNKVVTQYYNELNKSNVKCILKVSFNMEEKSNIWLKKIEVSSFVEWLEPKAYQRVCFVGKNQDVMIRWEVAGEKDYTIYDNRDKGFHVDPHCCSRFCLWFQADICTAMSCRCKEPSKNYKSYVKLAEVNRFVPFVFPLLTVFVWNIVNFEIILEKDENEVLSYYDMIKIFHKKYGGRTEIRFGTKILFLDVSIQKKYMQEYPVKPSEGKYHLGKYQAYSSTLAFTSLGSNFKFKL